MRRLKSWMWVGVAAVVVAAIVVVLRGDKADDNGRAGRPCPPQSEISDDIRSSEIPAVAARHALPDAETPEVESDDSDEEPMTAEERAEQEEEKRVDDFDNLTDEWMEPATNGVTMADVDAFVRQFEQVPKDRKEECLQRALNLIPDENVMLLAGVLLDKRQDKELVELVFNDILNRDDDVKNPILRQILQDKTHPCWKDAAWILDEEN